jgi:hypothetical protein
MAVLVGLSRMSDERALIGLASLLEAERASPRLW